MKMKINILIYSTVLGGMGDIMYAKHLGSRVVRWCKTENVPVSVKYAFNTLFDPDEDTAKSRIQNVGISPHDIVTLERVRRDGNTVYGLTKPITGFELFLLAPVSTAFTSIPEYALYGDSRQRNSDRLPIPVVGPRRGATHYESIYLSVSKKGLIVDDLRRSFPNATSSNTVLFSVYNPEDDSDVNSDFDFPMGVGEGKFGMFLNDSPRIDGDLPKALRKIPYVFIYVGKTAVFKCLFNFVEYVTRKYKEEYPGGINIVMPKYAYETLENPGILNVTFITNVFPLSPPQFAAAIQNSLPDVLLTGNQSVSDVISCCDTNKTLWYQGDSWTAAFGNALNEHGGVQLCENPRESRGSLTNLKTNWGFDKLGSEKLMEIIKKTESIHMFNKMKETSDDYKYRAIRNVGIYSTLDAGPK